MAHDLKLLLEQAEERIISGQIPEAATLLSKISLNKIPRAEHVRASRLFRRTGAFDLSLRLLLPVVRPKAAILQPATPEEIAECAIALQRSGSLEEACELLEKVSPADVPEALLYKSIFRFSEWDYRGGVKHLLQLLNVCERGSYLQRLAQLNLASAFVVEESFQEAEALLSDLRASTSERGEYLMFCNSLEVSAQVAIFTGDYAKAEEFLTQAEAVVKGAKTLDALWVMKWRAIAQAFRQKSTAPLVKARAQAVEARHWETVRELDFASCKVKFDAEVYRRLYFGTQFPAYRRRLVKAFGEPAENVAFVHEGGEYRTEGKKALNLFRDLQDELSPGDLPHLLFMFLISDAYRNWRSGQIHSKIFPGEYFNPYTSLDRVHQVVTRLRKAMVQQIPGIDIFNDNGIYKLDLSGLKNPIEIPKELPVGNPDGIKIHALILRLGRSDFNASDVESAFSISRASANRLIAGWREGGLIESEGKARSPVYRPKKSA